MLDLNGKRVGIVGLQKSGIGAANLCVKYGAAVTVFDRKNEEELAETAASLPEGVTLKAAAEPEITDAKEFDLLVISPAVPQDAAYVIAAKAQNIPVISEIELAYHFCKAPMIGVTGTNGKTTTTSLIEAILKEENPASVAAGNIGLAFSEVCETVPEEARIVLELSSFQLEAIDEFHPQVATILNLTPDHLNRHHTFENYVAAKCRIFENQSLSDVTVFNFDDVLCRAIGQKLMLRHDAPRVLFFTREPLESALKQYPEFEGMYLDGNDFVYRTYTAGSNPCEVIAHVDEMQIFGAHNEENAMAAILCCLAAGVSKEAIVSGLKKFPGVEHRIEPVGVVDGVSYYNDSKATNPDAAIKGLLAMKSEKTVLIGGGYDKGTPYEEWCRLFNGRVRKLVLLGQTEQDIRACAIKEGFPEEDILHADSLKEAVELCRQEAHPGDSVLLSPACASWGMFKSYEQRGDMFRDFVKEMI